MHSKYTGNIQAQVEGCSVSNIGVKLSQIESQSSFRTFVHFWRGGGLSKVYKNLTVIDRGGATRTELSLLDNWIFVTIARRKLGHGLHATLSGGDWLTDHLTEQMRTNMSKPCRRPGTAVRDEQHVLQALWGRKDILILGGGGIGLCPFFIFLKYILWVLETSKK